MVEDVTRDGKYVTPAVDTLTVEGAEKSRPMPAGSLTLVCSGTVGVPAILAVDACIHDGFLGLKTDGSLCDIEFLYYAFSHLQHRFNSAATHGGIFTNLTTTIVKEFRTSLPPLPEQRRIAEILGTWDEAIALVERRIAAARQRKQGLMQRLLTGRVRFPGFEGEWKAVRLGEVAEIQSSNVDKKSHDDETPVVLCNYMDVFNNNRILQDMTFMKATASQREIDKFSLREGDVLITKDSETAEDIAQTSIVAQDIPGLVCGYHLAVVRPGREAVWPAYLSMPLAHGDVHKQFVTSANGVTRFGLTLGSLQAIKLRLPSVAEQRAIASVVDECDDEIDLLSRKLAALQRQKKGLMQRLLTGRVRVTV